MSEKTTARSGRSSGVHFEPYVHLAGLSHRAALLSWGGFFFRAGGRGGSLKPDESPDPNAMMVLDDEELVGLEHARSDSIGEHSEPYGDATVRVSDAAGRVIQEVAVRGRNHVWIEGLEPDTEYRYRISVEGKDWLAGERHDWVWKGDGALGALRPSGRRYSTTFRTHPAPDQRTPLTFAVIGDFGVGIEADADDARRQQALARALERAVDRFDVRLVLTTGDNVYLRDHGDASGDEDDDWLFTFYQPYRYLIERIPFYPAVGNHDASDNERSDDRDQLDDNFYLGQRFTREREAERASVEPGLFYRFRYGAGVEFVCLDTTLSDEAPDRRFFEAPTHRSFLEESFPPASAGDPWRIPFSHHPVYCAGPSHDNTPGMERVLAPLFERAGVRLALAGHEHNFQYSRHRGVHYVLSGAGGQLRTEPPTHSDRAHTVAWAARGHFLIVELDGDEARVHALDADDDGELRPIPLEQVGERPVTQPITIKR